MEIQQQTLHMGPLPAPEDFSAYNIIVPGAAERILAMAEADGAHVRLLQRRAQAFLFVERLGSRILSAFFATGALGLAAWLAFEGHDALGGIIAGTTIAAVVAALVLGKGPASE